MKTPSLIHRCGHRIQGHKISLVGRRSRPHANYGAVFHIRVLQLGVEAMTSLACLLASRSAVLSLE